MTADRAHTRLEVLDGWRTVSVALVILNHLVRYSAVGTSSPQSLVFDAYGHLGVQVFFVISGFVICRGLEIERTRTNTISYPAFHIRRFFRIVPPLVLYLAVVVLFSRLRIVNYDLTALPRAVTFTCNFWSNCGGYVANHLWSLSVEEQFYIVFPLLFLAGGERRRLLIATTALALPFLLLALAVLKLHAIAAFLSDFLCVAAGVVCAQFESVLCKRLGKWPLVTPIVCLGLLVVMCSLAGPNIWSTLYRYFLLPPLICVALLSTISRETVFRRLLSSKVMTGIGRTSYSLYLWQQLGTAPYPNAGYFFYFLSTIGCLVLSWMSFAIAESKLIGLGSRLSRRFMKSSVDKSSAMPVKVI